MPQNVYDDPEFFSGYSQLPRSMQGLSGAPEWPAVRAMLPDLDDARVLDLGCGFGAFGRWATEQGAQSVLGIDLSNRMLSRAQEMTSNPRIEYRVGDMANLAIPERNFDLIYSALAFHYVADFPRLCRTMRSKLRDGGRLVATVEHPIFSAPSDDQWQERGGRFVWPLNDYLNEGRRARNWFAEGVIKYHRTIGTYVNALIASAFRLATVVEWGPDTNQIAVHPEWERERDRPMFLLFAADAVA